MACKSGHTANGAANTAVCGFGTNGATGVAGTSDSSAGVYAESDRYIGLYAYSGKVYGVYGWSPDGDGVKGVSEWGHGVQGVCLNNMPGVLGSSALGPGVMGLGSAGPGVWGRSSSGNGVVGSASAPDMAGVLADGSVDATGLWAQSTNSAGVYANSENASGVYAYSVNGHAVYGTSSHGDAVRGDAQGAATGVVGTSINGTGVRGSSLYGNGVYGAASAADTFAVLAIGSADAMGIWAESENSVGLYATSSSSEAIRGESQTASPGLVGTSAEGSGVYGRSSDTSPFTTPSPSGVLGSGHIGVDGNGAFMGVRGQASRGPGSGRGYGVVGDGGLIGVYGRRGWLYDVSGNSDGPDSSMAAGAFVKGPNSGGLSLGAAHWGAGIAAEFGVINSSNNQPCLLVEHFGTGLAAELRGNVLVTGNLMKSGGGFQIDHPLDRRKRLQHSFVESSEMLNLYAGTVPLDARGRARVRLPRWFGAINKDFAYQLTCIGAASPVYVSREIRGGSFEIAGGRPRQKVCWQVTAVRKDRWANANRIEVEVPKPPQPKSNLLKLRPLPDLAEFRDDEAAARRGAMKPPALGRLVRPAPPKLAKPPEAPRIRKPKPLRQVERPKDPIARPGGPRPKPRGELAK